ncbi:MAG: class I SAM-dependent methyltransferase [Acidobacteriota bacterium]
MAAFVALALGGLAGTAGAQRGRHGRLFPPEDLGILEGPDRDAWQKPEQIMDALGIADGATVADLGAGGGWFTVRLARRVGPTGRVYAEDIQPQMIESIRRRVDREGLKNVTIVHGTATDPRLPTGEVDAVLIVDTYNELEDPVTLLRNVASALAPRGRLGIIDFKSDGLGPGPPPEDRVDEKRVLAAAEQAGLRLVKRETFLRYQYMLVFGRAAS